MPPIAHSRKVLVLLAGVLTISHNSAIHAADEIRILEEVVVTATRRTQTVSEVPLAITVLTGDQLQLRGVADVQDLARISPSLVITTTSSETAGTEIRIRGIGTSGNNPGLEPSVGIFVDSVYRSRSGLAVGDLLDIASVEILRGPQGTLFGRNTSAGAISINTLKPEYQWGGFLEASVQNYDGYKVSGGFTGPLVDDKLAFRLAASYHERDGYVSDRLVDDREFYDRNRVTAKGQLLWQPNADIDVRLIADYKHKDEHCCTADYVIAGPTTAAIESLGGIVKTDPFAYKAQLNQDSEDDLDEWGVSAETNWSIDEGLTLTWVGAYRDADGYTDLDADTSNVDLVQGVDWDQNNTFMSQELRLNGVSGRLDWLVGAYYYTDDIDVDWSLLYGADFGAYFSLLAGGVIPAALFPEGAGDQSRYFEQDGKGWALFTHNMYELTDNYDVVLGFRWSNDDKDAKVSITNNAIHCAVVPFIPYCPVPDVQGSRNEDEPTGTIKLVRNLEVGNIYAGYSRGYKAGGFNLDRDAPNTKFEFEPEIVNSYEAGLKWGLENRMLEINSAVFYSEFQDYQINEFDGVSFTVTNAGQVNSTGAELELNWLPVERLNIDLGVTWTNTQFDQHPGYNNLGQSLEGKRVPFAPEWAATGAIGYEMPIGRFTGFGTVNASYMDDHNSNENLDPEAVVDAFTVVNARLGLRTADATWDFSIWGKNIFDEEFHVILFNTPLQDGSWSSFRGEPRMYGATLRYDF
jgi:iron complex outermembrane recepter protein